ncbi:hypothetical protein TSAR_003224 [Trichomalopsis sarcophagae]|uniref:Uncharacterized protein n=1 Tax=Trichomalopsis sarcophagae TaxID=543379 RepID=A0A232EYS7_9HYME|nr:hypothetical protein TSAR_003224 [Trichomalopsis sarcophagae]
MVIKVDNRKGVRYNQRVGADLEFADHELLLSDLPIVEEKFNCDQRGETLMNVRAWVENHDKKHLRMLPLINVLESGVVEPNDRREFVRIAVSGMIEFNDGNLYPSCQLKTQLAKDIVTAFPKLCSASGGYVSLEHFYDPKTNRGFIEFRLKTLRLKLNPSEKKRSVGPQARERKTAKASPKFVTNERLLDDRDFNAKVLDLYRMAPTDENKLEIFRLTEAIRANRKRRSMVEQMSLDTILNVFPRYKDFNGEVIRREFLNAYPNNDTFLDLFPSFYAPRILQYCSAAKPLFLQAIQDIPDNNLKALILLPELLPSPNYTKRKENKNEPKALFKIKSMKTIPHENLLHFVNMSDLSALNQIYADRKSPFLICHTINQEKIGTFYVKTEGHLIHIGDDAMLAFDVLLKLHYCFDMPFASDLVCFYDFITGCVLRLHEPKGCCVALNSTLSNVTLTNANLTM